MKPAASAAIALLSLAAAVASARAGDAAQADYPEYAPARPVTGTLRSWGHVFVAPLLSAWENDFHRYQPAVSFDDDLASSAAALAGLYSGRANLGFLAREITPAEGAAYAKMTKQKLCPITVLTGSFSDPDTVMALGVFVSAANPVHQLDFADLERVFGAQPGAPARTWGDLGATGPWAARPIHVYSGPVTDAAELFFAHAVLHDAALWNCGLRQRGDLTAPDGKKIDGYRRVIDALAADPDGIALTAAGYGRAGVRALALSRTANGPFVAPTAETVERRIYPLARAVQVYINSGPNLPADPVAIEFLRYVESRQRQDVARRVGDFLPLTGAECREQLARLNAAERPKVSVPAGTGLRLAAVWPMSQMSGTWDHLSADGATGRLFLSAQDDHAVDVVDLHTGCLIQRISGGFNRPQGECYVPGLNRLVVTNGRDGTCRILNGSTLEPEKVIQLSLGADMIDYDASSRLLYVESGGTDANRGPGRLTLIDARTCAVVGEIVTGFRAAAMAGERQGPRLYVSLPGDHSVLVVDRPTRRIVARYPLAARPASMGLDEAGRRLFVATRTFKADQPPVRLLVVDADSGNIVASLPSADATENLFFDARHHRIYTTSLDGKLQVFTQTDPDHYSGPVTIPTVAHAGTSQLIPEMNLLCVAAPPHGAAVSQVWAFSTGR